MAHLAPDFSIAGKQAGGDKGTGTRSSLMYESVRIITDIKPKYVIWENVKNVLSKKHRHNFENYLKAMENLGYKNFYQVLNASDFNVPQHRERIFCVSIRNDIKKDFVFPEKEELKIFLEDILEDTTEEKYFISDKAVDGMLNSNYVSRKALLQEVGGGIKKVCSCLAARDYKEPKCVRVERKK